MRLFTGVELDDKLRAAVAANVERVRRKLERGRVRLNARWIPPENLHVTLWFLGEVDDDRRALVEGAMQRPFEIRSFTLRIAGAGAFPPAGAPRVLWMGVAEGGASLARLHDELGARLVPLGFEREARRYSAHLTIARVKDGSASASGILRSAVAGVGSCTISAVTLFRSRTSPQGASYEPLVRVPLRKGEG
jgi:2'-5' RNA ligase